MKNIKPFADLIREVKKYPNTARDYIPKKLILREARLIKAGWV